jgi:plastocyanin
MHASSWYERCCRRPISREVVVRRIVGASVLGLLLIASGCTSGPSGSLTYTVNADAASPEGKNFQYSAFFPSTLKASPGDTIVFKNASSQAPHTITFGVDERRSNQPPVLLPSGEESPVVQQPCYTQDPPTAQLVACPSKQLPEFTGEGYWNSGFLAPAPAPAEAGPKEVTLKLADDLTPGQYRYLCVLHGPMVGILNVLEEEGDRDEADVVVEAADKQLASVRSAADAIDDPEIGDGKVAAGWGNEVTAVNRFFPETIEVKAGQSVSWESLSSYEPHTVSFGAYQAGTPAPGSFLPKGPKSGGSYTSGDANSGIFGAKGGPFPEGPFALTFPTAGEYKYVCVLHPGMQGTVKVT